MPNASEVNAVLNQLTNDERRSLILWYRNYMVSVTGVDPSLFGVDFQANMDAALLDGDKNGSLRISAKDVIVAINHSELGEETVEMRRHFHQELGSELWLRLTAIGSGI